MLANNVHGRLLPGAYKESHQQLLNTQWIKGESKEKLEDTFEMNLKCGNLWDVAKDVFGGKSLGVGAFVRGEKKVHSATLTTLRQ